MPSPLNIQTVDDGALSPVVLQNASHLVGGVLIDEDADEIQGSINASSRTPTRDHSETTQAHRCAAGHRLAT